MLEQSHWTVSSRPAQPDLLWIHSVYHQQLMLLLMLALLLLESLMPRMLTFTPLTMVNRLSVLDRFRRLQRLCLSYG